MAINLTALATKFNTTDETGAFDPSRLAAALDRLWADVPGAVDISDDHPRFDRHVVLMVAATEEWADLAVDEWAAAADPALMNALEREAIRRIKETLALL